VTSARLSLVGDPHAKPDNLDKINTLFDYIEGLGNPTIWLGDLLDTKEMVRGKCLNTYIRRFNESKLKHYVLVGNHDWFNLECKDHSLVPLMGLQNVVVIDSPRSFIFGEYKCRLYPYIHDQNILRADIKKTDAQVIFGHFDIKNFDYGNGLVSTDGLEVSDFKGKNVVSGHYHKYQKVNKITYLGTPFSHSFGEANQQKFIGIYHLDEKTPILDLIETPFPRHISLEVNAAERSEVDSSGKDIYRVVLSGSQEEINRFRKSDGVKYIERPITSEKEVVVSEADAPEIQFRKWATDIKGYSDEVVSLGLEVLADV
jgi:DNA repair exonuclease SbcCD nuclease subunit